MAYNLPKDIANRCLTFLGRSRINTFADMTEEALETARAYDASRLDELGDALWTFSTRVVTLRPQGVDSLLWTPDAWASGTYSAGAIISYVPVGQGPYEGETIYWQTNRAGASTTAPDADTTRWSRWFGSQVVDLYDSGTTYDAGEIVIVPAAYSAGTSYSKHAVVRSSTTWYVSLTDANLGNAVTNTTYWAAWESGGRSDTTWGETAGGTAIPLTYPGCGFYLSISSSNADNPLATAARWLSVGGSSVAIAQLYPLGTGQSSVGSRYVYRLPYGYLRTAPQDPRHGLRQALGVPAGEMPHDWVVENGYLLASDTTKIVFRFVADVTDVSAFDTSFCEVLAARMARDLQPQFPKEGVLRRDLERLYTRAVASAKRLNAIEVGPIAPPLTPLITCRW